MNIKDIRSIVEAKAAEYGADGFEVKINSTVSASAETLKDEVNAVGYTRSGDVNVRVVKDGKSGFASSELLVEDEIGRLVKLACDNADAIDEKDEVPLFEGSPKYTEVAPRSDTMPSAEELKEKALKLQKLTYAASDKIVDGTQSFAGTQASSTVFISSSGLDLSYSESANYSGVYAAVKDGEDAGEDYTVLLEGKKSDEELVSETVENALSKLGGEAVDTGKYDIILDQGTASGLLQAFASVFSAKSAFLKISKYAGKEGEKVASDAISIVDDPFHPEKLSKCPFDSEGVACYRKAIIENGTLCTLLYNRLYAKKTGKQTTGNAISATEIAPQGLYIEKGEYSSSELLAKLGNGLYITELKGLHAGVNPQSGDFSLEAAGFVVENGAKTKAVKNITVADNFYDLLFKATATSNEIKFRMGSKYGAPEVMFKGISVSGK